MKRNVFWVFVLSFFSIAVHLVACKKTNNASSLLVLDLHSNIGADSIIYGLTYSNPMGRNISFSRIEYYISGIEMNGTVVAANAYVLDTAVRTEQYIAGPIAPGNYQNISFAVGIADVDTNHIDPSNYQSGSLAAQSPSMHFATDSLGYIFMAVEGLVDTSASGIGTPSVAFSYHIGADALLETVTLPNHSTPFAAVAGKGLVVHLTADFGKLLQNVNMPANLVTNTNDYPVLADTLASHIPGMFSYHQ